ncbi:lipoprotein signal peptidase [Novosphingobium endophyticum]|uniref:Lipoprotein signal peptidase n=1 Tax=Novosphingobium endophyticum TaxID=1955250 RepID=A0A916TQ83_9SPHN|nr:signal peptidase II [Novosphingobium endophyticum]GGB89977.1 lipoprotein signal peptidase [Novosphingobium endophyticum]
MSPTLRNRLIGLLIAALVFLVDQGFKGWVVKDLKLREVGLIELLPFFDLRWTQNFGVSLGLFTAGSTEGRWALVAMTAAIALFVFIWMMRERKMADIAALSLVLGGAAGNIRDRYLFGYVIDYADLHFGNFRPFLIFNIADAAITIGVLIILARSLFSREKPDSAVETAPES